MSKYCVRHWSGVRESFGNYRYEITQNGEVVAEYFHDYRGDEKWLEVRGSTHDCDNILTGGGPQPLGLSQEAEALLDRFLEFTG